MLQHGWGRPEEKVGETHNQTVIAPAIRSRGFLMRDEFLALCRWKSPRAVTYAARNDEGYIRAVTGCALATENERLRIEVLTLLGGWGYSAVTQRRSSA